MHGTTDVLDRLRGEGFQVSVGYLQYLLRERVVVPPAERVSSIFVWEEADVQRLKSELLRRGRGPDDGLGREQGGTP